MEFNYKCPFNTGWHPLNRGVRLIKVSFKVNRGNKFWDLGYCPLNRGCPLNTGFKVFHNGYRFRVRFAMLMTLGGGSNVILARVSILIALRLTSFVSYPKPSQQNRKQWTELTGSFLACIKN